MRLGSLILAQPHTYIYPRLLQQGCASPIYAGVGVDNRYKAAGYPCLYEGIGAGRGLSVMAARLQRHISGSSARGAACDLERGGFGVGAAAVLRRAFSDNLPVFHEDAADSRIFRRQARLLRAEVQRAPHVI